MYSPTLLEHFLHPHHAGRPVNGETGCGIARHEICGDVSRIFVHVEDGVVTDAGFQASGCGPGISCCSCLLDQVIGGTVEAAAAITPDHIMGLLQAPPQKRHCAVIAVRALQAALRDDTTRRAQGGEPA